MSFLRTGHLFLPHWPLVLSSPPPFHSLGTLPHPSFGLDLWHEEETYLLWVLFLKTIFKFFSLLLCYPNTFFFGGGRLCKSLPLIMSFNHGPALSSEVADAFQVDHVHPSV